MTLKRKIITISHHPSIIKDLLSGKSKSEIRMKIHQLDERVGKSAEDTKVQSFLTEQNRNKSSTILIM